MKKLVQRFALLALMLLPMLASATVNNVTVNYPARGTVVVVTDEDADYDIVRPVPTDPGYHALTPDQWNISGALINGSTVKIMNGTELWVDKDDVTITAIRVKFAPNTPTLTVNAVNGSVTEADDDPVAATYTFGTNVSLKATPAAHYQFSHWADKYGNMLGDSAVATFTFRITDDTVINAVFVTATYTLTVVTNPENVALTVDGTPYTEPVSVPYSPDPDIDINVMAAPPVHYGNGYSYSYVVDGSTVASGTNADLALILDIYTIHTIGPNAVFTVTYNPDPIVITANSDDSEVGTVSGGGTYGWGTTATLTANILDEEQFEFKEWQHNGAVVSTDNPYSFTVEEAGIYTAFFDNKKYPITLAITPSAAVDDGAVIKVNGTAYNSETKYYWGTNLTLLAENGANYNFQKWSDDVTTNPRTDISVWNATNVNLSAVYVAAPRTVTFAANTILTLTGDGTYSYGESVTVHATPVNVDEYEFLDWQVNGVTVSTDADYTFTVEDDVELTARYQGVEYTVNVATSLGDDSEGTAESDVATVRFGESFTLTASPAAGHVFKSWEPGGITATPYTVTSFASNATHELNYTASFGPEQYVVTVEAPDAHFGITIPSAGNNPADFGTPFAAPAYTNADASKYELIGWKDNNDNALTMPFTVTGNTTVIAVIDSVEYDLTLTNATIAGNVTSVKYNTHFTLTPADIAGKTFKNWKVNGVDGDVNPAFEFVMTNANMEIEAVYEDVNYTVTVNILPAEAATDGATAVAAPTNVAYEGTTSLTATASTHYHFVNWTGDDVDDATSATTTSAAITDDVEYTANFAPNTYNVTINIYESTLMGNVNQTSIDDAEYGSVHTLVATPETGYQFVAWKNGDVVLSTSASYDYTVEGDATITAVFGYSDVVLKTFVARYDDTTAHVDAAWGAIAKSGVEQYTGEITLTATAADAHHVFKGWSDGVMDAERTVILMSDTSFYAFFALDSHSVVYAANDANMGAVNGNGVATGDVVEHGTEIHLVAEPADHYHFVSWSDAVATADRGTETVEADVNVTATFAIDQVTITAAAGANGSVTPTTDQTVDYGTSVTLTATPDYGYEFESWSNGTATVTDNPYTFDATATETWTATFVIGQFTVTTAANPANAAATLTGAGSYDYMTSVDVTTTPATGYVFDHFEDGEGTEFASMPFDLTKDTNVIAVFDSVLVNINVASNDDLKGTVTASAAQAKYNTTVTLTANPVAGYKLVSWNDGTTTYAALNNDTTFTVPATDVTYTATFEAGEFEVAGVVADACTEMGTVSGTTAAAYGSTVTLTATANAGYHFVNWDNDDLLTDASHAFAVGTENTTHTAYFEANTYTLTVNVNEAVRGYVTNGGATVNAPIAVTFGEEITLEAVPNHGYQAAKWVDVDGNDVDGATLTFTYSVVGDASVTAMFDYMDYTVEATGTNCEVTGLATNGAYKYGQVATLTATPNEHYGNWKGWYSNDVLISEDATFSFSVESDSVLVARCDIDTHTVTLTVSNTARGYIKNTATDETIASDPVKYIYGAEINVEAVANEHYTFSKWNDDVTTAARTITVADADIALEAQFDAEQYDVYTTVADGQSAMGDVSANQIGVDYGTNVTITATPNTGYEFVNWTDDDDNDAVVATTASYSFDIEGNRHFTAHFDYKTFAIDITVPVKEMGYVEVYNENNELLAADSMNFTVPGCKTHTDYTIIANPKYGYNFANWTGDHTGTDATFVLNADDNVDVAYTANFGYEQFDVTLTANSDARGNVIGAGTYSYGNIINISAAANTGFHFVQWNDGNTDNPRALLIQNDTAFEAVFGMDDQNISQEGCNEVVWMDGEDTIGAYTTSGVYDHTFTDDLGVDYNVHNDVTVYTPQNTEETEEACFSFDWTYATEPLTESDVYNVDFTDVNGCEAVHTLNLTIYKQQGTKVEVNSCSPYTWEINGNTYIYDVADTYYDETVDANGCAKKDTLVLTFITPTDIHDEVTACDTYTWQVPGCEDVVYTTNTTTSKPYHDEATGCSATAYLVLTIQESVHTTETEVVACDEYDWTVQGTTLHLTESDNVVYEYEEGVCTNSVTLPLTINHSSSTVFDAQTACDSYEMTWTDNATEVFTTSGTYTHDYTSVENCPSTDEITITINNSNAGTFDTVVCDTYTWINAETYTADTTVEYTIANGNAVGCDSVVTLNLTVNYKVNEDAYAEACDTYEWNSINFTESGNITINSNGGAANGCDSITTLHLTIQHTVDTTLEAVAVCDQYEWIFNGSTVGTYTTSGDQVYEYVDGICEHNTATLPLTINTLEDIEETAMACETYTWNVAGQTFTYTEGGDKVETITDANGCTATATLHLTINSNPEIEQTAEACSSYDWTVSGQTFHYTASGDYVETITDGNCSGTATLHLTIHTPAAGTNTAATICEGATYTWNEVAYNEANTYYYDYTDANNCAVQDTLVLTVNAVVPGTNTAEAICEGATYTWNNNEYTEANTYYYDYTDANNCPVQDTLVLTVNVPEAGTNTAEAICDGATFTWNNTEYTTANTYYYDYTDANGCATQDTLVLTVNIPAAGTNTAETICEGTTYTWNNTEYTTANTYYYDYTDVNGCAVQDTLVLTVNTPVAPAAVEATACDTYTWTLNNQTYTTSGAYTAPTTDANGCAVNATLNLTINQHQDSQESATACDTYTWAVNNTAYTTSGAYTAAITDVNGCAATATLNLTVNQSVTESIALSDTGSVVFNNETFTTDTVVTVTYTAANGCDSTVTATITVIQVVEPDSLSIVIAINDATMGTTTPAPGTYYYHAGDIVSVSATAYEGYQFVGWEISYSMFGYDIVDTIDVSSYETVVEEYYFDYGVTTMNLTAIFEADTTPIVDTTYYTVALFSADTTMGTVSEGDSVMAGESFTATAYPVNGYNFVAWMNGADTASIENPYTFIVNADITLTAIFEADSTPIDTNHYTVTIAMDGDYQGCSVTPLGVFVVPADTVMTVTATDTMGLVFVAWLDENYDTVSYENPYTFTVNSDVTLYAIFNMVPTYTISVIEPSNGTITPGAGENIEVNEGADVTFTAVPDSGYMFAYWTIDGVDSVLGNPYTFYNVNTNHVITATFEVDTTPVIDTNTYYYVTLINADTTMGTIAESDSVIAGYPFTAYAIAFDGYRFTAWTGVNEDTISIENPYIFVPTGDITLIANFEVDSTPVIDTVYYNITVNYDATMGTVTGDGRYVEGTLVTLRATANTGYRFLGWVKDNDTVARTNEYAFVLNADVTLTAAFEAIPVYYTVIGMPNDTTMGEVLGSGEFAEGSTVTLTAQAFEGYHFVRWSNGETTTSLTFTVTEDVTLIAYFEINDTPQAIDETDMTNVTIYSAETRIIVNGAEGKSVNVYDINGRTVSTMAVAGETVEFRMANTGVYLVKVGSAPAKRVLVVR